MTQLNIPDPKLLGASLVVGIEHTATGRNHFFLWLCHCINVALRALGQDDGVDLARI